MSKLVRDTPPRSVKNKAGTATKKFGHSSSKSLTPNAVPMYVNVTGPGDYSIPGFTDKFSTEVDSNKRTAPSFSLANHTKQPYWPKFDIVSRFISDLILYLF